MARRSKKGLVAEQLEVILDEIEANVEKKSEDEYHQAALEAVELLRAKSPVQDKAGGGRYAKGWDLKPVQRGHVRGWIVYNATDYQLTHLLEKEHALWNGKKRSPAIPHIRPVEEVTSAKVLEKLEQMKL